MLQPNHIDVLMRLDWVRHSSREYKCKLRDEITNLIPPGNTPEEPIGLLND